MKKIGRKVRARCQKKFRDFKNSSGERKKQSFERNAAKLAQKKKKKKKPTGRQNRERDWQKS